MNNQRKQLFKSRNEILREDVCQELFLRSSEIFYDEEIKSDNTLLKKKKVQFKYKTEKWFDSYATHLKTEKPAKNTFKHWKTFQEHI